MVLVKSATVVQWHHQGFSLFAAKPTVRNSGITKAEIAQFKKLLLARIRL